MTVSLGLMITITCSVAAAPSPYHTPQLSFVTLIANPDGNLRDPSSVVQDPILKRWHFWVDFVPVGDPISPSGWHSYQHHYSASAITGPWKSHGLAFNHSTDPDAWDSEGQFSPSIIYSAEEKLWYYFYSGTGANYTKLLTCAQLVRRSESPDGPWSDPSLVAHPTGSPVTNWTGSWNARRLDSGRALIIGGKKGYWTKGCSGGHGATSHCSEGLYLPARPESFAAPYVEFAANPIYAPDRWDRRGYENCEFFKADSTAGGLLHIVCSWHGGSGNPSLPTGPSPHFVVDLTKLAYIWARELSRTNTVWAYRPT